MTDDDILGMADEAGSLTMIQYGVTSAKAEWLIKFARLVAEREREECAKVCDDWPVGREDVYSIGEAIRARSEK